REVANAHRSLRGGADRIVDQGAVVHVGVHRAGEHGDLEVATLAPQVVDIVPMADADDVLVDDRTVVEDGGGVVRRHPDELHAPLVRLTLSVWSVCCWRSTMLP